MLTEGQTIGNYRVVRKLGEGGMGAVFEAVHQEIGRRAAIKVLHPQFAASPQVATRFHNEAKAANLIEHPGVVEIFEFGRLPDGTTFIVMEFLKGDALTKRIERGALGVEALRIARQIASVLAAAHEKGIIHRDLKPDNVIIVKDPEAPGGERAKVLDFGIAKLAEEHVMKTQANSLLGTPVYMAPEQCRGAAAVTDKSDVYSLGVIMYEMIAGQPPFTGAGIGEIMAAHLKDEPPPLRERQPSVNPALAAFVHRLLAKDPAARPSMREVITELEGLGAVTTGVLQAVTAEPSARYPSLVGASQRHPVTSDPASKTIAATAEPGATSEAGHPRTMAIGDPNLPPVTQSPVVNPSAGGGSAVRPVTGASSGSATRIGIIVGLLAALLAVGGVIGVARLRAKKPPIKVVASGDSPENPSKDKDKDKDNGRETAPKTRPPHPAPAGMVYIAGARFQMGSSDEEVDGGLALCRKTGVSCRRELYEREQPQRSVEVSAFAMDQTEVTNEQMVAWLNTQKDLKIKGGQHAAAGKTPLLDFAVEGSGIEYSGGKHGQFSVKDGAAQLPVVAVTWEGAQRYCAAQDKRLPTEAEWELAARGPEQRLFPWGAAPPRCNGVVFGRGEDIPADRRCPQRDNLPGPVGKASQDRTPDGVMDLGGNVAEWVQDRFEPHYPDCASGCKDPVVGGPDADDSAGGKAGKKSKQSAAVVRVIRGGTYSLAADACRGAGRSRKAQDLVQLDVGFRCVKTGIN